ncbi:MAG: cytochrome c3 family protein [Desulfuromonadaceae bacterium]|nr:cytochrome c3 family protein [Desulfuromonadaceae bacterium]MDD5105122.1 cytochrome c3 family protein [Desulfuromonadaceae bacterium]
MLKRILLSAVAVYMLSVAGVGAAETKDIKFNFKNADPVVFSHELHLKKYHNNCRICHNTIYNLKNSKRYTMAEMEKTRSCGACHTGMRAFSVASEKGCSRCHSGKPRNVTYTIKGLGSALFSHEVHIEVTGGACKGCHNGTVITGKEKAVTMAAMENGRTCGACHNGKHAFAVTANCDRCHQGLKPKEIIFNLKGTTPATFSHAFHTEAYSCKDCHTKTFPYKTVIGQASMDDMGKGKSCGACHNGKDAFASGGDCDKCHKGMKPGKITFKTLAGEAMFSHEFHLEAYKCADCHTKIFPYKAGKTKVTMGDMENGKSCGTCHNKGKDAFSVQDECGKCHKM